MADPKNPEERRPSFHWADALFIAGMGLAFLLASHFYGQVQQGRDIPYSQFREWVANGAISDLTIGENTISGTHITGKGAKPEHFTTVRVDPQIAQELERHNIKFAGEPPPGFLETTLGWILPMAGFLLLWMFLLRPMMGGGAGLMGVGRSRAKIYAETNVKVAFADVAGVDEAKQELTEVVGFLKAPSFYGRLGARIPKGVLLVGPPGTGKTLLARAVAGEADVPFISITGSEFVEMFVGVGAARVRDLFEQARRLAPAIIFIDELDALGRARGVNMQWGGHDEKEQTLNQLLAEMDGFDPSVGIIVLAATNRPEILDPALLRAGRFDRQVLVDRPDRKGRADILRVHTKKIQIAPDLDIDAVAGMTPGFTGADLANLVNEAALAATRRKANTTMLEDFTEAIERIVAGLEKKSRILSPKERERVAHHEMGHALVAISLPGTDPVHKVSIIPHGLGALGYTMQRPTEERFIISQSELANKLAVLLGGRAAETVCCGEVSTGAADDLARATDIAREMAVRFGMADAIGPVAYERERGAFLGGELSAWQPRNYSEGTAETIDKAVKGLIETAFSTARGILERNRAVLEDAARELLAKETLGTKDLEPFRLRLQTSSPVSRISLSG